MVCLVCLVPLFLIPVVSALPLLFDFIMAKIYAVFGWEYVKPARAPPACPYKPATNSNSRSRILEQECGAADNKLMPVDGGDSKND